MMSYAPVNGWGPKVGPLVTNFKYINSHLYIELYYGTLFLGPQPTQNGAKRLIFNRIVGGVFPEVGPHVRENRP